MNRVPRGSPAGGFGWTGGAPFVREPPVAGIGYMLVAAAFFSVMGAGAKVLGETLPVSQIIVVRGLITMALSAGVLWARGRSWRGTNGRLLWLRGLFGLGGLTCFFHAVQRLPLADASVLFYVNPIFTALAAVPFLNEALRPRDLAGLALAFAGVVCVARPEFLFGPMGDPAAGEASLATASASGGASLGVALALGGAAFSAGSYITIRKLRATDDPWVITLYFTLVAVPLALPLALQYGRWPTSTEWVWLAVVGLCTQVGQILGAYGLHKLPAGPAVALGYAQVAFAFGWGVLLFDEPIRSLSVFGASLVFGGVLVIGASVRARVRAESPPIRPAPTGPQLSRPADRPVPRVE